MPSLTAVIDSKSKWLVGPSSSKTLAPESISFENIQRTFSPPERTFGFFSASFPLKSIFPKNPRMKDSSFTSEYWLNQSTMEFSSPEKYFELSVGKFNWGGTTVRNYFPTDN